MKLRHLDIIIRVVLCVLLMAVALLWMIVFEPAWAEEGKTLYVTVEAGSYLKLRDSPRDGDLRVRMERGEAVTLIEAKGDWAYVACGSEYGWASREYLSTVPPADGPQSAEIISNGRVALRDKPDGSRLKWLHPGDPVIVYGWLDGAGASWARVDGGYVDADYIKVEATPDEQ